MEENNNLVSTSEDAVSTSKKEKDEEGSAWVGILFLALIALAIWALVHFNPSERDHKREIASVLTEAAANDMYLVGAKNFEYHSQHLLVDHYRSTRPHKGQLDRHTRVCLEPTRLLINAKRF